jgi:glycosyltransferase involved in cell wall biosynthesis
LETTDHRVFGSSDHGIVVFSHLRWGFVWQRPQQFLSRFATQHPVLFLEEPIFELPEGEAPRIDIHDAGGGVTVGCPHLPASMRDAEDLGDVRLRLAREAIDRVNVDGRFDNPLLWYYSPMDVAWAMGQIPGRGVVYDCMDELSQFKGAPEELVDNERRLLENADIVFTGGYELWLKKSKQHANVHFFGCGVEYEHFAQAQDATKPLPEDVAELSRPIVGWFGVVDERVDYDLLKAIAEARPEWSVVVVGPVVKVDPDSLPQAPNLHWLGGRDYKQLPDYCRSFDVCMMAFALNEATEYINPTKALEYLATGKPVVSTPVSDVVRQYSDSIYIARSPDEMIDVIERALAGGDPEMRRRGLEKAQQASWECTVEKMQALIEEAVSAENPPGEAVLI